MIEIFNTHIIIHNYKEHNQKLERSLGVWDPIYFKVKWTAFKYNEENNTITIPRGYDLEVLKKLFPKKKVIYNNETYKAKKIKFKMKFKPRDINQQNSLNFLIGNPDANEYFNYSYNKSQKMLCLDTGGGKTFLAINYASIISEATMIIIDQDHIIKQWKSEILKFSDLKDEEIGILVGSESITSVLNKPPIHKLYLVSHRTLYSYMKKNNNINDLFKYLGIGLKIYDEAHTEWTNIINIDLNSNVKNNVYLTATPGRSNKEEDKVYWNVFDGVVQYGQNIKYKEEENYHTVVYVDFNSKPDLETQTFLEKNNKHGFDTNGWFAYMNNKYDIFLSLIQNLLDISFKGNSTAKIAIVIHPLYLVERVIGDLEQIYPDKTIGNFTGLIKNKELKKEALNTNIIVTTDKSFDKAVNVPDLEILINTVPLSSPIKVEQLLGRLRRIEGKKSIFFDITDVGFTSCKKQKYHRKQILNLKAQKIFEMKF